jgi:hypothetical protein
LLKDIRKKQAENSKHKVNKHQSPDNTFYFHKETRGNHQWKRNENIIEVKSRQLPYIILCKQFLLKKYPENPGGQPEKDSICDKHRQK